MVPQRLVALSTVVLALTTVTGCGDAGVDPTAGPTTTMTEMPPQHSTSPQQSPSDDPSRAVPTVTPTAAPRPPITLSFAGDVHFEGQLSGLLNDPASALAPIADRLSSADLTILNLETAIGTSGTPEQGKRFTFQAPPTAFDALAAAGVDVVTMANNHAVDYGRRGLDDTLAAIAADPPLSIVGVGSDIADAFAPAVIDVNGTRVAVLGASMADDPTADPTRHWAATATEAGIAVAQTPEPLIEAVAAAEATAHVVVVYLHWGVQGEVCPSDSQTRMARALADAGADIVVGSHTHTLQGFGLLDDTFVAYGLGNFAWYLPGQSGLLSVTVEDGRVTAATLDAAQITATGLPEFTGEPIQLADRTSCADLRPVS